MLNFQKILILQAPTFFTTGVSNAGQLLVHAHCYLHRPSLVPFGHRIPLAPQYLLKLKSAEAISQASHPLWQCPTRICPSTSFLQCVESSARLPQGMHAHPVSTFAQPSLLGFAEGCPSSAMSPECFDRGQAWSKSLGAPMASPVTAESLNRATHELALRMLAQPEVDLYERRGKQLSFLPDR